MTVNYTSKGVLPFTRQEVADMLPVYDLIDDCIAGSHAIKKQRTKYLPKPNPHDRSDVNEERYKQYLERAVFHNVTGRTLAGLTGTLFLHEPTIELPTGLEVLTESVNGIELGLGQLARRVANATIAHGRSGIFTDYPTVDGPITLNDSLKKLTPIIRVYNPQDILNWKVGYRNGRKILRMVVLHEKIDANIDNVDAFTAVFQVNSYRILYLENDIYKVKYWVEGSDLVTITTPTDANGKPFNELPFTFVGAENNDELVDVPPLAAIANCNLGHYRCSADYYESCYVVGQPTTVITGLTENWVHEVFNDQPIVLGSRQAIPLPTGGSAMMLQAAPNSMPAEAMDRLERQMVSLGAQIVQQRSVQRTATEANIETAADDSILGNIAKNIANAFTTALKVACRFANADPNAVNFEINNDLGYVTMSAQDRQQLVTEWQASAISFTEMRAQLKQAGVASEDDNVVKAEGEALQEKKMQDQIAMMQAKPAPVVKGKETSQTAK